MGVRVMEVMLGYCEDIWVSADTLFVTTSPYHGLLFQIPVLRASCRGVCLGVCPMTGLSVTNTLSREGRPRPATRY